jgi:DNA repair exonuclease SbcCD nuclease subunit
LRNKNPINRIDDILETQFKKLEWIFSYAEDIDCKRILFGGDLFHTPSVPDIIATRFIKLLKRHKIPFYFIIGNHDVTGGNTDSKDYSKIGIISECEYAHHVVGAIDFDEFYLTGYDFSKKMECPKIIDPINDFNIKEKSKPVICMVHSMITDEPSIVDGLIHRTINWAEIQINCDLLFCGHFHPGYPIRYSGLGGVPVVNCGALIRQEASHTDLHRDPQICVIKIDKGKVKLNFEIVPHDKEVFDMTKIISKNFKEHEKYKFIEALKQLKDEDTCGNNVIENLKKISLSKYNENVEEKIDQEVIDMCVKKLEELT